MALSDEDAMRVLIKVKLWVQEKNQLTQVLMRYLDSSFSAIVRCTYSCSFLSQSLDKYQGLHEDTIDITGI